MSAARAEPEGAHRLSHRVLIAAPRPKVWRLVEDPEALMQWVDGLRSVDAPPGSSGGFVLGATFVQRIRLGPVPSACQGEVIESVPPARLGVRIRHALFGLSIAYDFAAEGRRTAVSCRASVQGAVLGKVVPRHKVERVTRELLAEHLAALKALAERDG